MTASVENTASLKKFCLDLGFSLFGVADITDIRDGFLLADRLKTRFPRAVSLGKRLIDDILDDIDDKPTPLYFNHYRQINFFLDRGALVVASHIQDLGFGALPIAASQIVDWPNQRAHLSHKHVALRAGLGWIGRSNLLVNGTDAAMVDRIISHLKLTFVANRPPPCLKSPAGRNIFVDDVRLGI